MDEGCDEFVQLLRVLQTREDFIDELMQIRRASDVGYVEIKTFPGYNVPLYLDAAKLGVAFKNGTV